MAYEVVPSWEIDDIAFKSISICKGYVRDIIILGFI